MEAATQTVSFFELPPEVRNYIYGYALGGHVIHIFWRYLGSGIYQLKNRICCAKTTDADHARSIDTCDNATAVETIHERHARCQPNNRNSRFELAILLSCRQVNEEAALIPYAENVFTFGPKHETFESDGPGGSSLILETFMSKSTPQQMSVLKGIVLIDNDYRSMTRNLSYLNVIKVAALANLKQLTLLLEVRDTCDETVWPYGHKAEQFLPGLLAFAEIQTLESVCFCVTREVSPPWEEHWVWWKSVEEGIVGKHNKLKELPEAVGETEVGM